MRFIILALLICVQPAFADMNKAVIVTQNKYAQFAQTSQALVLATQTNCTAPSVMPAYHAAFDAWVEASIVLFGPLDEIGGLLSLGFWPDKKGFTAKTLRKLIAAQDIPTLEADNFAQVSIAGKGFFALDHLLGDATFNDYGSDSYTCKLVQAIAADLAHNAQIMDAKWQDEFARTIATAGQPDNALFLSPDEVAQAYLTTLAGALEYIETQRLARPLGSFEKQRPKRAEAWRTTRPLRNIEHALSAAHDLATALGDGQISLTQEAFVNALDFMPRITDKDFTQIADTSNRFQAESLQTLVSVIHEAVEVELGAHLGVTIGFNALDGD
ncbi:MAG: signal peptidase [Rhodobacteraceae bacterium]|nr:MAG: signal peptidase [Paracoccaceae bacterium]